jgi:ferredoxin
MDIKKNLLKQSSLVKLVHQLNLADKEIFAPVKKNDKVDFGRISSLDQMATDYIVTEQSAKFAVFPRIENLFEIETTKDKVSLKEKDLAAIPEVVLVGTRPCDAAGFITLWGIFGEDQQDNIFHARLNKLTIISISCSKSDSKCFCTSVKLNPGGTKGSDILLTCFDEDKYLAEIITEKGQAIADKYSDLFETTPDIDKEQFIAKVPVEFNVDELTNKIYSLFEFDIWLEQSMRCIGCGTCAFICPTCGCFDIQDVFNGETGQRNRNWDACGFSLFSLHASGHNPRETQAQRWRQRVLHKFAYMLKNQNLLGCVGCGRCSRLCPSDMNLQEHLIDLYNEIING